MFFMDIICVYVGFVAYEKDAMLLGFLVQSAFWTKKPFALFISDLQLTFTLPIGNHLQANLQIAPEGKLYSLKLHAVILKQHAVSESIRMYPATPGTSPFSKEVEHTTSHTIKRMSSFLSL